MRAETKWRRRESSESAERLYIGNSMSTTCTDSNLILIAASSRGPELQAAIEEGIGAPVCLMATFADAASAIAVSRYRAVVIDEGLADLEPTNANRLLGRLTDELPIFVKLAISGVPRCVQTVQLALRRFERERHAAMLSIHGQVRDQLTSILVCSQLAMKVSGLPTGAIEQIECVTKAAESIQQLLADGPTGAKF